LFIVCCIIHEIFLDLYLKACKFFCFLYTIWVAFLKCQRLFKYFFINIFYTKLYFVIIIAYFCSVTLKVLSFLLHQIGLDYFCTFSSHDILTKIDNMFILFLLLFNVYLNSLLIMLFVLLFNIGLKKIQWL